MHNRKCFKAFIAVFSLIIIFSASALAQNKRVNCSSMSDAAIARLVNAHISRLKARNPRSNIKIDVRVKNKIVRLTARRAAPVHRNSVARYAKSIRCVRRVELANPTCSDKECPRNQYMCNGECVPCIQICSP